MVCSVSELTNKRTMNRLRAWRTEQGYSLAEVADLVGLSTAMLSRIETGDRQPSARTRVLMARRLDVPVRTLFELEPIEAVELAG